MTLTGIVDNTFDTEVDVRYAAQMSSLGSLADDVLGDLARVRAGLMKAQESKVFVEALALLNAASASTDATTSLWAQAGLRDALRRMAASPSGLTVGTVSGGVTASFDDTRQALEKAVSGKLGAKELSGLEHFFDFVSSATLETAVTSIRGRGPATSWSTI